MLRLIHSFDIKRAESGYRAPTKERVLAGAFSMISGLSRVLSFHFCRVYLSTI